MTVSKQSQFQLLNFKNHQVSKMFNGSIFRVDVKRPGFPAPWKCRSYFMSFLSYMDVAVLSHPRGCSTWDGRVTSAVGCVHSESERVFNRLRAWCMPSSAIQTLLMFKTPVSKAMLSLQGHLSSSFTNIFSSSFIALSGWQGGEQGLLPSSSRRRNRMGSSFSYIILRRSHGTCIPHIFDM